MQKRKNYKRQIMLVLSSGQILATNQIAIRAKCHWYSAYLQLIELEREGKIEAIRCGQITLWKKKEVKL
jgi:Mn-dependent DtxR family transcriptional regulator